MTQPRKHLTEEHIERIISEWDQKSVEDFATEFGVVPNTIRKWVADIRDMFPDKCPRKGRRTRRDVIRAAVERLEAKAEDRIEDIE